MHPIITLHLLCQAAALNYVRLYNVQRAWSDKGKRAKQVQGFFQTIWSGLGVFQEFRQRDLGGHLGLTPSTAQNKVTFNLKKIDY